MANVRPSELPVAASVTPSAAIIVDSGATVDQATPLQIVDAARPLASQAEAEGGLDNAKMMSPLRVQQAIATSPALAEKEDAANKVVQITPDANDDEFPSAKAVLAHVIASNGTLNLADFYVGTLPYVNPASTITYAGRQAAPNINAALNAALTEAQARLVAGERLVAIRIPSGIFTLSAAITIPSGVVIVGAGDGVSAGATQIRTIQTAGNTFNLGDPTPGAFVFNAGLMDLMIYQDHGGEGMFGYENPAAGSFMNKATSGYQIYANYPRKCVIRNVTTYGKSGVYLWGGVQSLFSRIDVNGIWDSASASRQEGIYGLYMDGDLSNIPTWHYFEKFVVGGQVVAGTSVSYPGAHSKSTVKNIGFQYGVRIKCAEEPHFDVNISACQKSDVLLTPYSTSIIQGVRMQGILSPCGTDIADAYIKCENGDAGGFVSSFEFIGEMLGQGNGFRAVSDYGSTGTNGSFASIIVRGKISSFVGGPFYLTNARHVILDTDCFDYNYENWYTGDDACGAYFGAGVKVYRVSGIFGGTLAGDVAGHNCIDGIRSANAYNQARNIVTIANGGLTGSAHVCNGKIMDRLLEDGSVELVGSNNFTYDIKSNGKTILVNAALTAQQNVTLPTSGVPTGWSLKILRTVSATGAFNVVWGPLVLSAVNTYGVVTYYDGVGWLVTEKGVTA